MSQSNKDNLTLISYYLKICILKQFSQRHPKLVCGQSHNWGGQRQRLIGYNPVFRTSFRVCLGWTRKIMILLWQIYLRMNARWTCKLHSMEAKYIKLGAFKNIWFELFGFKNQITYQIFKIRIIQIEYRTRIGVFAERQNRISRLLIFIFFYLIYIFSIKKCLYCWMY